MEELKLILEAVAQLGAQGKEAFIWWLIIEHGFRFISLMAFIGLLFYIAVAISRAVSAVNKLKELRDLMEVGSGCWADYEFDRMKRWVERKK